MTGPRTSISVLHVDDDQDLAELTASFLERADDRFTVETAASATEGLDRLADADFDCVVSDYEMPGTDGLEFLDAIRESHPDLPVILFTGKGSEAVAGEAITRGVTDYLQKQTGTEQYDLLANRVANAVDQYRARRRVERLDRIQQVQSDVHSVLAEADTRTEIEARVCEVVGDADPYRFAWVGSYRPDDGAVEPRTTAGVGDAYLDDVPTPTDGGATGAGPTGRAVRTRELAVSQDLADDPAFDRWRDDAAAYGYRSSAAVPLVYDDTLYGVLNVYADQPGAFDDPERELLAALGDSVAHAIHRVEADAARRRYRHLVEALPVGVYRSTADGDAEIRRANSAFADIVGADSAEALRGTPVGEVCADADDHASLRRALREDGVVRDVRHGYETLDGDRVPVTVTAVRPDGDDEYFVVVEDVADRRERERDLERFRSAVEHAGHSVLITDTDGTIEYVNRAFESITGYSRAEAVGESPAILQSGEHDQSFYRDLWGTILGGEVWQGEVVNEREDGERYVVDQTIAPITDDGDRLGFVAVNRDVTDRKERERDLTFLKRAVDQAGIGLGTYGADGSATYVNHRIAELFGTDRETLRNRRITDLDGEYAGDWTSFDGDRRIFDTRIERLDTGEAVPVEVVESSVEHDGATYRVRSVRDVADRRERERDLERFRSAVEHAGHGVIITDTDGTIEYVNDAFTETSGYSASEAVSRTPSLVKSGEHDQSFYRDLWGTILGGEVWQGEVVNEREDGERYVVDQTIAPIIDGDEIRGFVAINRDVTELKRYERELEAQNERLKEYGHTVAHDLRNPLNLLHGQVETLRATADASDGEYDPDAVLTRCDDVATVIGRMENLVDDLLRMAEQGQLVLDARAVSLADVAADAWRQVETADAAMEADDTTVNADPDRLRELLSNLCRNAIEHAGPEVSVRVGPLDFADGFYVEDDGPGIPAEERDRVLDRGYTTAEDGTGYGLAIVEQIADAHGWETAITDGNDGGARFEFRADT